MQCVVGPVCCVFVLFYFHLPSSTISSIKYIEMVNTCKHFVLQYCCVFSLIETMGNIKYFSNCRKNLSLNIEQAALGNTQKSKYPLQLTKIS